MPSSNCPTVYRTLARTRSTSPDGATPRSSSFSRAARARATAVSYSPRTQAPYAWTPAISGCNGWSMPLRSAQVGERGIRTGLARELVARLEIRLDRSRQRGEVVSMGGEELDALVVVQPAPAVLAERLQELVAGTAARRPAHRQHRTLREPG